MTLTVEEAKGLTETLITLMKNYQEVRDRKEGRMTGSQLVADEISRLEEKRSKLAKQRELLCDKLEKVYPIPDQTFYEVLHQVEKLDSEISGLYLEIHRLRRLDT